MSYTYEVNPEHEFEYELSCIQNPFYKKMAIGALHKFPDYFWDVPASSSGAYHPRTSLGRAGLVRHVKSVFAISEALLAHPTLYSFNEGEKDMIRIAILIHDACKQGYEGKPTHTLHIHPLLPKDHLKPDLYETFALHQSSEDNEPAIDEQLWDYAWEEINKLVETHMGPWNRDKKEESDVVLPEPKTEAQLFVHMCDYLASRKEIEVDIFARTAQDGYKKAEKMATDAQLDYILKLYRTAKAKNIQLPDYLGSLILVEMTPEGKRTPLLTSAEASALIDQLKSFIYG
ncbi:hypothetical protein D1872_51780 [compost metagenome]